MHVSHLSLADFRSYAGAEVPLGPGVTAFVGPNGQGKTNLVEAIGYLATLGSHRVASDAPLVRLGADRAVIRAAVAHGKRQQLIELEINPGKANRARINRSWQARSRDVLGIVRTVLFAPEDPVLVEGDPGERRRCAPGCVARRRILARPRRGGLRRPPSQRCRARRPRRATMHRTACWRAARAHRGAAGNLLWRRKPARCHRRADAVRSRPALVAGSP